MAGSKVTNLHDTLKLAELKDDISGLKKEQSFPSPKFLVNFGMIKVFHIHRQKHCQLCLSPLQESQQRFHDQTVQFLKRRHVGLPTQVGFCPALCCEWGNGAGLRKSAHRSRYLLLAPLQLCLNSIQPSLDTSHYPFHSRIASDVVDPKPQLLQRTQLSVDEFKEQCSRFRQGNLWDDKKNAQLSAQVHYPFQHRPLLPHVANDEIGFRHQHCIYSLRRCSSRHSSAHLLRTSNGQKWISSMFLFDISLSPPGADFSTHGSHQFSSPCIPSRLFGVGTLGKQNPQIPAEN